jgi:undecaprenyl phosphate-alpha-L-ara4N flippase subunit ArnE
MLVNWQYWLLIVAAAINSGIANILVKQSRLRAASPGLGALIFSPWFIGGLALYGLSVLLFAKGLDKLPVSIAYPMQAGMAFAVISVLSSVFIGEPVSVLKLVGYGIIIGGMVVINL